MLATVTLVLVTNVGETYGGRGNFGNVQSKDREWTGRENSIVTHLPLCDSRV